jgi:hypothetical protein
MRNFEFVDALHEPRMETNREWTRVDAKRLPIMNRMPRSSERHNAPRVPGALPAILSPQERFLFAQ